MSTLPKLALCATALTLAFAPLTSAQGARPDAPAPSAQRLALPGGAAGYLGALDDFGARVDADGDLIVVTDPIGLSAGVVSIANVAFEEGNLLTVPSQTVTNITHVFDAAIEGSRAAVLVGVSGNSYHLLEFQRINILGNISWIFNSSVDVTAAVSAAANVSAGFVDLVNGDAAVTIDAGFGDYYARFTTSPLTFEPHPSGSGQFINTGGFETVSTALAPPPQDPGPLFLDATHFQAWGGVDSSAPSNDAVLVQALGTSWIDPAVVINAVPAGRNYGAAVALHDDLLFIGVPGDDTLGTDTGCVEVWRWDGFVSYDPIDTFYSPRPQAGDRFGRSLDVSPDGSTLAIGELHNEVIPGATDGAGYIRFATIAANDTVTVTHDVYAFASSVSVAGENLGADLSWAADGLLTQGAPGAGIAGYIGWFFEPPALWIEVDQSPALAGASGEPTQVLEGGIYADGPLVLGVEDAAAFSTAYLIVGLSTINAPAKGGIVYPALNLIKAFPTNGAGERILPTLWLQSSVDLGPFDTYIQWWVADAGGPAGFSATAGGVIHQY